MNNMRSQDEFRHTPRDGCNWQENYVWHAWDAARNSGWYIHLGNIHDHGLIDLRVIVVVNGVAVSLTSQSEGTDCFGAPGLDVTVMEPLRQMKMRFSGMGGRGASPEGLFGATPGDLPFGFAIEFISEHPVVDWGPHMEHLGMDPLISGNHYEQGARWKGKLWAAGQEIEAEGLLVRDHSWGARAWRALWPMWLPIVLDDSRSFISGLAGASQNRWKSFTVLTDHAGTVNVSYDNWVNIVGPPVPRQFDTVRVLRLGEDFSDRYEYEGHIHFAFERHSSFVDRNGQPIRRALTDMYSTVRGRGKIGFSTFQTFSTIPAVRQGYEDPLDRFVNQG